MKRAYMIALAFLALTVAASCTAGSSAKAKAPEAPKYPTQTISVIVPFNAGSNTDRQIRFIQPYIEKALGGNIVVINKGGASGIIGVTEFLAQKPDGYTVLFTLPTPTVYKPTAGDTEYKTDDLIPVSRISTAAMFLAVSAESEFKTGKDVLGYIQKNPGDFTYANAGNGGIAHLAFASFLVKEGFNALSIPFTGGTADGYTAVMGGHVKSYVPGEQDLVGRTDVRPVINLGSKSTTEGFTDIPTLEELGYKGYEINNFSGFYFMKGVDEAIIKAFDKAVAAALSNEEFLASAKTSQFSHAYANAADFTAQIKATVALITPVFASLAASK